MLENDTLLEYCYMEVVSGVASTDIAIEFRKDFPCCISYYIGWWWPLSPSPICQSMNLYFNFHM